MSKKWLLLVALSVLCFAGCSDDSAGNGDSESMLCGNSKVESSEACDDGNTQSGDGCISDCSSVEEGYTCPPEGGVCTKKDGDDPNPQSECGNGKVESGEICDDGNTQSGDGCSANCVSIEDGYICPNEGESCQKTVVTDKCGNGELDEGESCDDGNTDDGDGCAADCMHVEAGYVCQEPGQECIPDGCGNGIVEGDEECDAGDYVIEYGYDGCTKSCKKAHFCGDGKWDKIDIDNGEKCDAGADTSNEYDGCTAECERVNYCGDGQIQSEHEKCDDGNDANGDGCSSDCQFEDGYSCTIVDGKSVCMPILCGNGVLDENEACDDGNRNSGDGCASYCQVEKGYRCTQDDSGKSNCMITCGDGTLDGESGEQCDDHNLNSGDGCSEACLIESGFVCPEVGSACIAKACGDGILAGKEECDDGNTADGDGCSYRCKVEKGWLCDSTTQVCTEGRCGDGIVQVGEECDNDKVESGSPAAGDGCSDTCRIEPGYECKIDGGECKSVTCGDGTIAPSAGYLSYETCDLGTGSDGKSLNDGTQGCAVDCTIVTGYHCDDKGMNCVKGTCGDGFVDAGEECDDKNHLPADGCSPDCKFETGIECVGTECKPVCGDGVTMWMLDKAIAEECDDGNLVNGDGCSSDCKVEKGYVCTEFSASKPPEFISLPVTYRDFRSTGRDTVETAGTTDGFITAELIAKYPDTHWTTSRINTTIYDFDSQAGCSKTGYTLPDLDEERKPVLATDGYGKCFSSKAEFAMWYRNIPGINKEVKHHIYMWLEDEATKRYYFTSVNPTTKGAPNVCADGQPLEVNYFLPLASTGFGYTHGFESRHANYSFTSEVSTYFQYKGGETLNFSGDDDLWVFLNGHLFVDLGGLHGAMSGTGKLGAQEYKDSDGNTVLKADGTPLLYDPNYNVYEGGIYEIKLFHAERNATGSNFSLTLTNFLNSGTASCDAICGDGVIRGSEECDYVGIDTDVDLQHSKGCSADCKLQSYCGNGKIEKGEQCDTTEEWCVECKLSPDTCGNGVLDAHEECDGDAGVGAGQKCLENCRLSGCGDGILDANNNEECDDGNTSDEDMCTSKCTLPVCGDKIVQSWLGEVCDDGTNDGSYGGCGLGCTYLPPACGDGVLDAGEQCDHGKDKNHGGYNGCNDDCTLDIHCGDGVVQSEFEQCDEGDQNGKGSCSEYCAVVVN